MVNWSKEELRKIGETDDLHISPFREEWQPLSRPDDRHTGTRRDS